MSERAAMNSHEILTWLNADPSRLEDVRVRVKNEGVSVISAVEWLMEAEERARNERRSAIADRLKSLFAAEFPETRIVRAGWRRGENGSCEFLVGCPMEDIR